MRISLLILIILLTSCIFVVAQEPDIEEPAPRSKAVRPIKTVAPLKAEPIRPVIRPETKPKAQAKPQTAVETRQQTPSASQAIVETKAEIRTPQPATAEPMGENDRLDFMRTEDVAEPQEPSSSGLIIKSIGALALVIALLFAGTWTLKKLGFGGKKPTVTTDQVNLAIVSSIAMGGGRTLSTIQFGDRVLLVGTTAQSFTLLAEDEPFGNRFSPPPRSVADLLAGDDRSFEDELALMTDRWEARERIQ